MLVGIVGIYVDDCLICGNEQSHRFMKAYRKRTCSRCAAPSTWSLLATTPVSNSESSLHTWTPCLSQDKRKRNLEGELTNYELTQLRAVAGRDNGWQHRHVLTWPIECFCYNKQQKDQKVKDIFYKQTSSFELPEQVLTTTCELCQSIGTLSKVAHFYDAAWANRTDGRS